MEETKRDKFLKLENRRIEAEELIQKHLVDIDVNIDYPQKTETFCRCHADNRKVLLSQTPADSDLLHATDGILPEASSE